MDMKTMQLVPNPTTTNLTTLDDNAIEAFFADLGVAVSVVAHCDDAACPVCFSPMQHVRAA